MIRILAQDFMYLIYIRKKVPCLLCIWLKDKSYNKAIIEDYAFYFAPIDVGADLYIELNPESILYEIDRETIDFEDEYLIDFFAGVFEEKIKRAIKNKSYYPIK